MNLTYNTGTDTVTATIAASLFHDLEDCVASREGDTDIRVPGYLAAFANATPVGRHRMRIILPTGCLTFLADDIGYRLEINLPTRINPYGVEDPDPKVRRAAERALETLAAVGAV